MTRHERSHTQLIAASAKVVYQLVADVSRWPAVFGPTVYVNHLWRDGGAERFRIWATVNGEVAAWTSQRKLDYHNLRISFEQERSQAPVASMGGSWTFREFGPEHCEVELRHHFTAVDDDPGDVQWISTALDANGAAELAALRRIAESGYPVDDVLFAFEDVVHAGGCPAAEIYEFIRRGDLWAERLPHVRSAQMTEDPAGIQHLTMETMTADGSAHTTSSTRLLLDNQIIYKQHVLPDLLSGHSGQWTIDDTDSGAVITARHVVALRPEAVTDVMGPDGTLAAARTFIHEALSTNSRATLDHARAHAQALSDQQ